METKQSGTKLPEWNSERDKYLRQHTSEVQLFSSDPGSHRASRHSHLVLQLVGIGIPVLLACACFCWGDHHTGWSAYVHQRRSQEVTDALLGDRPLPESSPATSLVLGR